NCFDLNAEPTLIARHLGALAARNPGLRVPGSFDGFEVGVRAILGQQISVKAAATLAGRFAAKFGESIETGIPGLTHMSPTAERVAEARPGQVSALGITSKRSATILAFARAAARGDVRLTPQPDVESQIARLQSVPGIGGWTAQYIAMRALSWPDAFPHTDLGIMKALKERSPAKILIKADSWRPWRAYATMHLWKSLEGKQ
ncbi:MAG: adenosine deaminase, partial [Spirochaetia bacterium]|nr:adenosine deaminase [Spirochaetia bacterium]